jgi:hypothetical protein
MSDQGLIQSNKTLSLPDYEHPKLGYYRCLNHHEAQLQGKTLILVMWLTFCISFQDTHGSFSIKNRYFDQCFMVLGSTCFWDTLDLVILPYPQSARLLNGFKHVYNVTCVFLQGSVSVVILPHPTFEVRESHTPVVVRGLSVARHSIMSMPCYVLKL